MRNLYIYIITGILLTLTLNEGRGQQDSITKVLNALNQQVDYLNETDRLLYPEYLKIIELNDKMWQYYEGKADVNLSFSFTFSPSEDFYRRATYNKLNLPEDSRDDLVKRLDSLKSVTTAIAKQGTLLSQYLSSKAYQKDNMYLGFEYLKNLGALSRTYLVRHEDLHSVLLNVWYDFYVKKRGRNINYLTVQMNRVLSQLHVVYLDLGYDPGYVDVNRHLKEVNGLLETLRSRGKTDTLAKNSADFQIFTKGFDTAYFANYGEKRTIAFYKKYNQEFVRDINSNIVPAFNRFIAEKKLLCIKGKTEPPFYDAIAPVISPPTVAVIPPKPPEVKIPTQTVIIKDPKTDPVLPTKPSEMTVTLPKDEPKIATMPRPKLPPPDTQKVSLMEGYAINNLIFLLDVSGSMRSGGRLDSMKNAMRYIVREMRPEDKIGIITYSGNAQVVLKPTPAAQKDKILGALDKLNSEGSSNLRMGLDYAYLQMNSNRIKGGNNRIIVVTDGYITLTNDLQMLATEYAKSDIRLSVMLFGSVSDPNINVTKLTQLATSGKGNLIAVNRTNARTSLLKEAQQIVNTP